MRKLEEGVFVEMLRSPKHVAGRFGIVSRFNSSRTMWRAGLHLAR